MEKGLSSEEKTLFPLPFFGSTAEALEIILTND